MPGFNAPLRVAIATGDTNLGVFLCGSLKPEGYAAGYCADGLEALNALERDPFDLLILDTDLPLLDGLELCRRLRLTMRNAATPILMISARGDVEDRVAGLEAGADDYLPRPFAVRELRARVHA